LKDGITNEKGRIPDLYPNDDTIEKGTYKVTFYTGEWFEKNFDLPLRTVHRKGGSQEYYISDFLKKKKGLLEYNNRYGFTYGFTKKFLTLKKGKGKVFVEDYLLVD
jgi:hypothetical protein